MNLLFKLIFLLTLSGFSYGEVKRVQDLNDVDLYRIKTYQESVKADLSKRINLQCVKNIVIRTNRPIAQYEVEINSSGFINSVDTLEEYRSVKGSREVMACLKAMGRVPKPSKEVKGLFVTMKIVYTVEYAES